MYLAHYILPFIIYWITQTKDKVMLWGLLLGNLVDLGHIYYRLIGKVGWFESACPQGFGTQCSFGFYPFENWTSLAIFTILAIISFQFMGRKEIAKWVFWISIGALLNYALDYIHLITGFAI
tara:strand:+ start:351 stop:716 length:366 start_codon:yes stop_codon:yes gene_type:complete